MSVVRSSAPSGDGAVHAGQQGGELRRYHRGQTVAHVLVGQVLVDHRPAGDVGDDRGDVVVAECLRPGQDQVGVGRLVVVRACTATAAMSSASTNPTRPVPAAVRMTPSARMLSA